MSRSVLHRRAQSHLREVELGSRRLKGVEEMLQSGGGSELEVMREGPSEVEPDEFVTDPNSPVS